MVVCSTRCDDYYKKCFPLNQDPYNSVGHHSSQGCCTPHSSLLQHHAFPPPNPSTSHHGTGTPISLPYRNVSQDYYYAKPNATYFPGAKPQTKDGACTPFDARQRGVRAGIRAGHTEWVSGKCRRYSARAFRLQTARPRWRTVPGMPRGSTVHPATKLIASATSLALARAT